MELTTLQTTLETLKKGTYTKITFQSVGTKKGYEYKKITTMVVRLGIDYKNLSENKEKDTFGELKGKSHLDYNNYLLGGKDGKILLRVYPSKNPHHKTKTKYFLNGVEVSKLDYNKALDIKPRTNGLLCFDVNISNIISLG